MVPPFGPTECAGSGGEGLGGVPPPTEYGKESGLGLTRQHPDGYGEFKRSAHSAGPGWYVVSGSIMAILSLILAIMGII